LRSYREIALERPGDGFKAYLIVEPTDRSVSFGGTRIDPSVTREMVADLAENMSLKLAGHGSPVGGAKAGICVSAGDPRLTQFLHEFAAACRDVLSSSTILGKDMGAKQWMLDEIYAALQIPQLAVARQCSGSSACPDRLFELDGYIPNMTGQGVFWAIDQALGGAVRGTRVLIQGFGTVGAGVACHLAGAGAALVGVNDSQKAIVNEHGLPVEALLAATDDHGLVDPSRLPGSCAIAERDGLLTRRADVLVLAAGSYLIDHEMAAQIEAPLVVEAANLALTPTARTTLHARDVRVIPDVVANSASAALVGHQIAAGNTRCPRELWADIERNIRDNTEAVHRLSRELGLDSKAAFCRLVAAARQRRDAAHAAGAYAG